MKTTTITTAHFSYSEEAVHYAAIDAYHRTYDAVWAALGDPEDIDLDEEFDTADAAAHDAAHRAAFRAARGLIRFTNSLPGDDSDDMPEGAFEDLADHSFEAACFARAVFEHEDDEEPRCDICGGPLDEDDSIQTTPIGEPVELVPSGTPIH